MRMNSTMAFAASMVLGAAMAQAAPMEPAAEPAPPGSARNKPSGSKPVPGGGARERERRLRRMNKLAMEIADEVVAENPL